MFIVEVVLSTMKFIRSTGGFVGTFPGALWHK